MRFVIDAQLPPGLAARLVDCGHEAEHVRDIGLGAATDLDIWRYAQECEAVLVTKDQDFVAMAQFSASGPAVVWIRLGNTTNRALWGTFAPILNDVIEALASGERVIEVA